MTHVGQKISFSSVGELRSELSVAIALGEDRGQHADSGDHAHIHPKRNQALVGGPGNKRARAVQRSRQSQARQEKSRCRATEQMEAQGGPNQERNGDQLNGKEVSEGCERGPPNGDAHDQ